MRIGGLILINFLFITWCNIAEAAIKPVLGISAIKIDSNNKELKYINSNEITPAISYGFTTNFDNLIVTIQTNRFIEFTNSRSLIYKNNLFEDRTKIRNDNLTVGYRTSFLIPGLILSNVKVDKALYNHNKQVSYQTKNTLLTGINLGLIISKNNILNLFLTNSNKELELTRAYGISFNHLF